MRAFSKVEIEREAVVTRTVWEAPTGRWFETAVQQKIDGSAPAVSVTDRGGDDIGDILAGMGYSATPVVDVRPASTEYVYCGGQAW